MAAVRRLPRKVVGALVVDTQGADTQVVDTEEGADTGEGDIKSAQDILVVDIQCDPFNQATGMPVRVGITTIILTEAA